MAGRSLCLLTREVTSGGSIVQTVKKCVTASGTWQALGPVTLTVQHSGNSVAYLIQQTGAKTGDSFLADSQSLADVTASPSPHPPAHHPVAHAHHAVAHAHHGLAHAHHTVAYAHHGLAHAHHTVAVSLGGHALRAKYPPGPV